MSFRHCYSALFVLLLMSVLAFAQEERTTEFSVGYSNLQAEGMPDRNDPNNFFTSSFLDHRTTLHGVNGEVTLYPLESSVLGLTANISLNRMGRSADVTGGSNKEHTNVWYFMAGPAYVFPDQGRLVPFIRVMAGLAHTGYEAAQERSVANGNLRSTFNIGSNDFAMAFGAGLDVKLSDRFKIRLIQADYAPIFLGDRAVAVLGAAGILQPRVLTSQRQDNVRFTFGVTF